MPTHNDCSDNEPDPPRRRKLRGRRLVGGMRSFAGLSEVCRPLHYLTKAECDALARSNGQQRQSRKPQFERRSPLHVAPVVAPTLDFVAYQLPDIFSMSEPATIQLMPAQTKLLNCSELAKEMRVSPWFVTAMIRAGYKLTHGTQTTYDSALAWRAAFPEFRAHHYMRARWKKRPKLHLN